MQMSLDDLFLLVQRAVDRLVRRVRLGGAPPRDRRRFLIVQIDGLSRAVLERALATGCMPFVRGLLRRHGYRVEPMSVGMPTSTPAFQLAAMYGVRPDIPGFHYHDKRRSTDIYFPRAGHAALVEEQAAGRPGILRGGSAYGCVFTGGADNNLFSFATLWRPTGRGVLCALGPFVILGWVFVKSLLLTLVDLVRALLRLIADPVSGSGQTWRWLTIKLGLSVWVRELFTLAVSRDLYAGAPAIYVNYLDYDVAAHAFGPGSRRALRFLRRIDRAIHQLWRVLRRVPEHQYDVYILSDHGQAHCRPYQRLTGAPIERQLFREVLRPSSPEPPSAPPGLSGALRAGRRGEKGFIQHFLNYLLPEDLARGLGERRAHERDGVRVIAAGPNAFVYIMDTAEPLGLEALERRFPGLAEEISLSRGVGFVLVRSGAGPACFWRGKRYQLRESEPGPFAGRDDVAVVLRDVAELMAMPSAGDLVIYGIDAPDGHVSFVPEVGAHAGPSPEELHTFILHHHAVALPETITHPRQLYDHFIRYQESA
jgi:hypothetical protein